MVLTEILQAFWFFGPAGLANMAPVLVKWIPFLDYPVDFHLKLRGRPLFGSHKTWRGLFFGILIGVLGAYIQSWLYPFTQSISLIDYTQVNLLLLGSLLGLGALLGDMIKSMFKRQFNIKPGKPWVPFDQLDWIVGSMIVLFYVTIPWLHILIAFFLFGALHPLTNYLGYIIRIKKSKW
ncbi:TPA: CDP-archaeol synthase [Candidatus Woesearchaeota archaeon]|nr:CDP-archaeol synthase [Candidatus Woesearchaeota archaeon]